MSKTKDQEIQSRGIVLLLLVAFLLYCDLSNANVTDWREIEVEESFVCFTNSPKHPFVYPFTKKFLCDFVGDTPEIKTVTITSGCNRKSDHHGKFCTAVDVYFDSYQGGSIKEWALEYLDKIYLFLFWAEAQWDSHLVTIGIYPPHFDTYGKLKKNSLHLHIAYNNRGGRFGYVDGSQVSIVTALQYLEEVINSLDEKGYLIGRPGGRSQ